MSGAILNTYLYGSYVYGTNDEESDIDYIQVVDVQGEKEKQRFSDNMNITSYPLDYFQSLVNKHVVSSLECVFLNDKYKIEIVPLHFKLDLSLLRRSFSEKASNSWVKAHKKIDMHNEYRLGRKSLFHSLRILSFGIQIANFGKIVDYQAANDYWYKIMDQNYFCWEDYKKHWQSEYNRLKSEFKRLAPLEDK